jgi:hypothetical protein
MTQLTMTRPAGTATRAVLAPVCGAAVFLLASAMTQSYDAGDWQFLLAASAVIVVVAAAVAYVAVRRSDPRTTAIAALSLAILGLASSPLVFWLGIPEVFGATATGLALEYRASQHGWTAASLTALVAGLTAICLGAAALWIW